MPLVQAPPASEGTSGVEGKLQRIFRHRLKRDVPSADTDLFESGALDSLSFVELLVGIEDELGIRIQLDELDLADVRSIAKLARLVARQGPPVSLSKGTPP